jgi:chromosome segregation ATPase
MMPTFSHLCSQILAQGDSQVIEVVKEPGFAQWIIYLLVFLIVADKVKGWVSPARREVSGELVTSPKTQIATKEEVDSLKEDLDSFIEQNRAEHQNATTEGQRRVVNLAEVMKHETSELETSLDKLRDSLSAKMDSAFAALHSKMDPLIRQSASAEALISQIDKRLTRLEDDHAEKSKHLHARIDDAMKLASGKKA